MTYLGRLQPLARRSTIGLSELDMETRLLID